MITAIGFLVAAGLGSIGRLLLRRLSRTSSLPLGTLVANWTGAFALGAIAGWSPPLATVVGAGFLGSLTTFSTLSGELADLSRVEAVVYGALTVVGGIALAFAGLQL